MTTPKKTLDVLIPATEQGRYTITIQSGILGSIYDRVEQQWPHLRPFILTDIELQNAGHLDTLIGDRDVPFYSVSPAGERSKHIHTVVQVIETMEKQYYGRDTIMIALGGGTIGDMAGFAAAIYKRGIPLIQIPTTTVSQADSSVGGKTGVDSTISKNAFGAFWHPAAVYIDVTTLLTLDDRQYRAGLVESVKHAAIEDKEYFEFFEDNIDAILAKDITVLEQIAYKNCSIKASVVADDPTEQNKRRILNYGHTIGHAVESSSNYNLLHGECVGIGMLAAGLIEKQMGLVNDDRLERIEALLVKLNIPDRIPRSIILDQLIERLKRDKKAVNGWPKFVLLEELGKTLCKDGQWAHPVDQEVAIEAMFDMYKLPKKHL